MGTFLTMTSFNSHWLPTVGQAFNICKKMISQNLSKVHR